MDFGVVVFHLASALNTAKTKSLAIWKARDRSQREFQSSLYHLSRLEIVGFEGGIKVPNVHKALLVSRDEQWIGAWHVLDGHSDINFLS